MGQTPAERSVRDVMLILYAIAGEGVLDAILIAQSWEEEMPNF